MFTGLVGALGSVEELERSQAGARMSISAPLAAELRPGDSVAVDGVCLTATDVRGRRFDVEVMNQTLTRSALGAVSAGDQVNLELPLRLADRLGGHLVQGHVDGVGTVLAASEDGLARRLEIGADPRLLRYLVPQGSVAVSGVSLTVAELAHGSFTVSLIPETLDRTTLGAAAPGKLVSLEVDVLARYVERLMESRT